MPEREALFLFPKRDRAFRDGVVTRLRATAADAAQPISAELFELTTLGVCEFRES